MSDGANPAKGSGAGPASLEDSGNAPFQLRKTAAGPAPSSSEPVASTERAPSSYTIGPGTVLDGKFSVTRVIGHGGMGVVLAAHHLKLDVPVAVKLLGPEHVGSPDSVSRFLREARAASKLTSHHVARVLDIGTLPSGEPYIVMEYLDGEDLASRAKGKRLEIYDVIDYVVQASDAIAEAHTRGIVHRDIKPANLFLAKRKGGAPVVKVLDFGVSKVTDEGADIRLTQTSTILGSALYMSPEQMRSSKHVDQRTDIWALGVCLYELMGGAPPYFAESFLALCAMVNSEDFKPLDELRPDVPLGLAAVVHKALSREPAGRYANVAELSQALSPFASDATRARIASLLEEHAPELHVLPASSNEPMAGAQMGPGSRARTGVTSVVRPPVEASEPASGRNVWIGLGVAVAAVGLAAALWFGWRAKAAEQTASPDRAVSANAETLSPPLATASAVAQPVQATTRPAESAAAPASSASASPVASAAPPDSAAATSSAPVAPPPATATFASAPSAVRSAGPPHVRSAPSTAPRGEVPQPPESKAAAQPRVNDDLSQETCSQTLPDGTRRSVPCPH